MVSLLIVIPKPQFTVTAPRSVFIHPYWLLTVTKYIVVLIGATLIRAAVSPVLQRYLAPPVAVKVAVSPTFIVSLFTVGIVKGLKTTEPLAVALHPVESVAVTVYIPSAVSLILEV